VDPRSSPPLVDPAGALERFAENNGVGIENLRAARRRTRERLAELTTAFSSREPPADTSIALFGSWARQELTDGSDDDWAVLVDGSYDGRHDVDSVVSMAEQRLGVDERKPGAQGIFGGAISCDELVEKIGLDEDTNTNLTRRSLLLLESVEVAGSVLAECRRRVLERYLNYGVKTHRPPRFLLNDVVRYWRTIGVDFEGKHREGGGEDPKWVERNAKLRTSRKVLFAGGLLPILQCHHFERSAMLGYLHEQLASPPTDRIAAVFDYYQARPEGVRFFDAYDRWIGLLGDREVRRELRELRFGTRDRSSLFAEVRQIGETLDQSLITLLFETGLSQVTRRYAVL